jgi:O-antigen/teichoic acid export membrane protein
MTNGTGETLDAKAAAAPAPRPASTGRKLLMGSISRTVLIAAQVAVGFFMMPFLLEHLGNRWYGIWTVLSSLLAYFYLMDVGLGYAVQLYCARYLAQKDYARANSVINTALVIYSVISVVILLLTAVLATAVDRFVGTGQDVNLIALTLLIMGINVALEFPILAFTGIIGAYSRFDLLSYSRLGMLAVTTALTVYFVGRGYGIFAMAMIALVCGRISDLSFFLISKYCFRELKVGLRWFEKSQVRELANYSVWSMLNSISGLIKFKLQPMVIAFFSGPVMVTHYVVGSRLADYFRDLLFQATNLTMPMLARYHVLEQNDQIREKLRFLTKVNTLLAVFGGGLIIIFGRAFIDRWLGPEYPDAYPVLVVLVTAMAVEVMIDPARTTMTAMGKIRFVGVLEMVEALINVALTVVLVRYHGILGAALGMAVPLILLKVLLVPNVLCRQIHMASSQLYRSMVPTVVLTVIYLTAYGWIVSHWFAPTSYPGMFLGAALAVPAFLPLAYVLFEKHEIAIIRRILPF